VQQIVDCLKDNLDTRRDLSGKSLMLSITHIGPDLIQWAEYAVALQSFVISLTIVLLCSLKPKICGRLHDLRAVQSMHAVPTPRIGGIAIFAAIGLSSIIAPVEISERYQTFVFPVALIFFVGLAEDLGITISPLGRLLAAIGASLLVIWLFGVWLPRIGIPALDPMVAHWAIGVPLTLLITAGITHGFNLIDGVNGLAALAGIAAAVALALIARASGYGAMVHLAMMLAAGLFGFFLINFPLGKIFLGDAGAYSIGFVLSWFGISILLRYPDVSPWAILLTVFWPFADTLLAIYRRSRRKADIVAPDRLHAHQMVLRALEVCILGRGRRKIANPLTTVVLAPFVIAPPIAGVMLWNQNLNAFLATVMFMALFFASYAAAPALIRRFRR